MIDQHERDEMYEEWKLLNDKNKLIKRDEEITAKLEQYLDTSYSELSDLEYNLRQRRRHFREDCRNIAAGNWHKLGDILSKAEIDSLNNVEPVLYLDLGELEGLVSQGS